MIKLRRFSSKGHETIGIMTGENGEVWFTLEPLEPKLPVGCYVMKHYTSPKNGDCILLANGSVPESRGFEIHAGNTYKDTMGCILIGDSCDLNPRMVLASKNALRQLLRVIKDGDILAVIDG